VSCSRECRHRGPRKEGNTVAPSEAELERLFDPKRDPEGLVAPDEWQPAGKGSPWVELDACQTVFTRRSWFQGLVRKDRL
jgi:hypothetical protein